MRRFLPALLGIFALIVVSSVFLFRSQITRAATSTHVVISEVEIGTSTSSTDEFVELYNPTNLDVNLADWKLGRKTASGTTQTDLVSTISGTIKSHGYLLIASNNYTGSAAADITYQSAASSIANNNSLTLSDSASSAVDVIGLGTSTVKETAVIANPATNKSVERKATSSSTTLSMALGGIDEFLGNGEDTDNNSSDFVLRNSPQPQNSQSPTEPITPSPTTSPSPFINPTPTLTPSASPTDSPTPTISPTTSPSISPTEIPTATPTVSPSPTTSPTPSISATPTPQVIVAGPFITCRLTYRTLHVLFLTIQLPVITCTRT